MTLAPVPYGLSSPLSPRFAGTFADPVFESGHYNLSQFEWLDVMCRLGRSRETREEEGGDYVPRSKPHAVSEPFLSVWRVPFGCDLLACERWKRGREGGRWGGGFARSCEKAFLRRRWSRLGATSSRFPPSEVIY